MRTGSCHSAGLPTDLRGITEQGPSEPGRSAAIGGGGAVAQAAVPRLRTEKTTATRSVLVTANGLGLAPNISVPPLKR